MDLDDFFFNVLPYLDGFCRFVKFVVFRPVQYFDKKCIFCVLLSYYNKLHCCYLFGNGMLSNNQQAAETLKPNRTVALLGQFYLANIKEVTKLNSLGTTMLILEYCNNKTNCMRLLE